MDLEKAKVYITALFFLFFSSCESEDSCEEDVISYLDAGFYTMNDTVPEPISVDDFSAYGIGRQDSMIYDGANSLSGIELPLSPSSDTTGFVFTTGAVADTINFISSRDLRLISMECGFTTHFNLKDISHTSNKIDSIAINKKTVTTGDEENIQIYL